MNSQEMKKTLKQHGIDSSKISIKRENCGYSESYHIKIKDITIDKNEVENILKKFEYYTRDEKTCEILEGGNTYIFVEYDYNTLNEANNQYNNLIIDLINDELKKHVKVDIEAWENGNGAVRISENIMIYRENINWYSVRNTKKYITLECNVENFARTIIQMGELKNILENKKVQI